MGDSDYLGRTARSWKPTQLVSAAEVGRHHTRFAVHVHLAVFVNDGHTRSACYR